MPEAAESSTDGSYGNSFGAMASDASRATKAYADVTREKVASEGRIAGQMAQRGEEDRTRALEAYKKEGIGPEEFKPWNAEIEHKKYESEPLQGFASSGAIFAMIASAFTKAPMLSAIEGMSGALNGIKQGNEDAYTRAYDSWKENTKVAKQRHDIQHQAYTDALALGTHDLALSNAKLRAEASRFGDKQILALADNGMVKEIYDAIAARNKSIESAADLAERTTIRTMQKHALETSFAQIDQQPGPPGPDGQPTQMPEAIKAAQKLRLFNTVMASGKLGTPQQQAMAQLIMENPTMPVEDLLKKAEQHQIIKPAGGAGGAKGIEDRIARERAEQIMAENPGMPMTEAIGKARTEMKPDSKSAAGIGMQKTLARAKELLEQDPEMSETDAFTQAKREMTIESSAPSGNRVDDIRKLHDEADNAITKSEKVLAFLEKYKGGAGLIGKVMRGEEVATNIAGLSTQTDRVQFRRDVLSLQEMVGRVVTQANGRPIKDQQAKAAAVVAGLESGDTGPNTRRAYRELIAELHKRKKDLAGRITGGFDPEKRSSGAEEGDETTPPPGKKPPPANWLDMYPKK
jgi:hypothetical protein